MRIKAIFRGQNKSCGYKTGREYTLVVRHHIKEYVQIENAEGGGYCDYDSVVAFLSNWDMIRRV